MSWNHVSVDIETFSDVDIKKAGLYKYSQSPAFEILLIAWAVNDGPVRIVDLTVDPGAEGAGREYQALQDFLRVYNDRDTMLHAYNAAFEHTCLNEWARRRGLPERPIGDWRCTMAHGLYCGYTAGLGITGEAMGLPQDKRKLGIGAALIRRFCVPQKEKAKPLLDGLLGEEDSLTKVRRYIAAEPEKWNLFKEYCKQDVATEREIERRLKKWPMTAMEQLIWELTCDANAGGVGVDTELVDSALAIGAAEQARVEAEARALSGLDNPKSVQQLMKWLNTELETDAETEITDLRKQTVTGLLQAGVDSDKATRMLELRQQMSKTSTKKYDALAAATCGDGRVRGMLFYYGANRTGRWAGRIVQPQNLPQNHLPNLDYARQLVKARDAELLKLNYGTVPDALSQLIRTAFIPRPGKRFAVADYSAIEARVVAWLAGEQWVLDAFMAGKDIYCATASQMFGVPVEKHGQNSELRQRGKVAVLALGYGGGESALTAMGALRMGIPEEDLPGIKQSWRRANPAICALWQRVEDAAKAVIPIKGKFPYKVYRVEEFYDSATGQWHKDRYYAGSTYAVSEAKARVNVEYRENGKALYEGGSLYDLGQDNACEIHYETEPRNEVEVPIRNGIRLIFRYEFDSYQHFLTIELPSHRKLFYNLPTLAPAKNFPDRQSLHYWGVNQTSKKWAQTDTWGGKLVENITQAVARDCLAETLYKLDREHHMTAVFHVHDELIVEVDDESGLQTMLDVMASPVEWAPGLPLKGDGFICDYYRKE